MTTAVRERTRNRMSQVALCLAGAVVVTTIVAAWRTGAHRLPYSDDWAYLRMQDTLDRTGHIVGVGWNDVSLVGQLQLARVVDLFLDDSVLASRLVVIAAGLACSTLIWWLISRSRRPDLRGLAVLSFVVFPSMVDVLVTSMTDLPATALMLGCLAAGLAACDGEGADRRIRTGPLIAAVALGVAAITVRQTATAAPLAVVGVLLAMPQRPASRRRVLIVGAAGAVLALAFLAWRSGIDRSAPIESLQVVRSTAVIVRAWSLLALGLLPLVLASGALGRWFRTRSDPALPSTVRGLLTLAPAAWLLVGLAVGWNQPVVPPVLVREGPVGASSLATLSSAQSGLIWHLVSVSVALCGAALVAVVLRAVVVAVHRDGVRGSVQRTLDEPWVAMPSAFVIVSFAVIAASSYLQHVIQDRYLLPMLGAGMILLCVTPRPETAAAHGQRRLEVAGMAVACVLAIAAIWSVMDWDAYQAARFRGAGVAMAHGVPIGNIDAGFEYIGIHGARAAPRSLEADESYLDAFPDFRQCALVTADATAPPGMTEIGTVPYKAGFGLLTRTVHVYARDGC